MTDLPHDVERFIADHVPSLEQLEILLLLRGAAQRDYDAREVTAELRLGPDSAAARLRELAARGFLLAAGERYRFAPRSAEDVRTIAELARCYNERKVAVIALIFSPPGVITKG